MCIIHISQHNCCIAPFGIKSVRHERTWIVVLAYTRVNVMNLCILTRKREAERLSANRRIGEMTKQR